MRVFIETMFLAGVALAATTIASATIASATTASATSLPSQPQAKPQAQAKPQVEQFDLSSTIGKAQILLEVKDRHSFEALIKSSNGNVPLSLIVSQELLESQDGKKIADYIKLGANVLTPVIRLDASLDKKWKDMSAAQQTSKLQKFFKDLKGTWEKRFGTMPLKFAYAPFGTPLEVLSMLEKSHLRVIIPNATLDQAYAAQPETLNPSQTPFILYHSTATKLKDNLNLNTLVINTFQKLSTLGFTFVNAEGFYNNVPLKTTKAEEVKGATTNSGKEILVNPKMVEGPLKKTEVSIEAKKKTEEQSLEEQLLEEALEEIFTGSTTTLNPKTVKAPQGVATEDIVVEVKKAEKPEVEKAKAEPKKTHVSTKEQEKKVEEKKQQQDVKKQGEEKKTQQKEETKKQEEKKQGEEKKKQGEEKESKAEKAKKEGEAAEEEEGGISGTTIVIILVVVVAVLALLAVAYKKMKN